MIKDSISSASSPGEDIAERPPLEIPDLSAAFEDADLQKELVIPDLGDLDMGQIPAPATDLPEAATTPIPPDASLSCKGLLKKAWKITAFALLSLAIVLGSFLGFRYMTDPYNHRILDNVTAAGIQIGGMTRREAEAALEAAANTLSRQDMVVTLPHGIILLPAKETGARLQIRSIVRDAYLHGRQGSFAEKQAALEASIDTVYAVDLCSHLKLEEDYIWQQLSAYAAKHETAKTQYSHRLEGRMPDLAEDSFDANAPCQTLEITLGSPGFGLNMEDIYDRILTAYCQNRFQVTVEEIDSSAKPDPVDLDALLQRYFIAPVDAGLDMENYCPIPGVYGYTFDIEKARILLEKADYGETVSVPMEYVAPQILQDQVYFRDVLGEYKTPHTADENRNENLRIACAQINGKVLQPGETLSYNDTLGPRTKENGYKLASAYCGTHLLESYGGGIGQVSSTLYYCALLSDLEIVQRHNHGYTLNYIDPGLDATVSMSGPDFVFRNSNHFPIKIEAWMKDSYVNVRILGSIETDYYVRMEYKIVGQTDPGITYEKHGPNDGYYDGQLLHPGFAALTVDTYRCKYHRETDALISRELEARSSYMSADKIVVQIIE